MREATLIELEFRQHANGLRHRTHKSFEGSNPCEQTYLLPGHFLLPFCTITPWEDSVSNKLFNSAMSRTTNSYPLNTTFRSRSFVSKDFRRLKIAGRFSGRICPIKPNKP